MLRLGPAGLIGQLVFWGMVVGGWASGWLEPRTALLFLSLWLGGLLGLSVFGFGPFFPALVAVLDIALVLIIFEGDIRIS